MEYLYKITVEIDDDSVEDILEEIREFDETHGK